MRASACGRPLGLAALSFKLTSPYTGEVASASVRIEGELRPGRVLNRPNASRLRVVLEPNEEDVEAELLETSALPDLLAPGDRVWARRREGRGGAPFVAVLTQSPSGHLVDLERDRAVDVVAAAIEAEAIPELTGRSLTRRDVPLGTSRVDLEVEDLMGQRMLVMVDTAPALAKGAAVLPATRNPRGARILRSMARAVEHGQVAGTAVFVAPRVDATSMVASPEIDPDYVEALREAREAGVRLLGRRMNLTLEERVLGLELELFVPPR